LDDQHFAAGYARYGAGDRFDSLDLAISYTDPTIHRPTVDVQRHREALAAYRRLGATWVVVPGPTGRHPIARDFVEAFAEEYITA